MPGKLSIRYSMEPTFLLQLNDILDSCLFDRDEGLRSCSLVCKDGVSMLQQLLGSKEGADVFGAEGRVSLGGCGCHFGSWFGDGIRGRGRRRTFVI